MNLVKLTDVCDFQGGTQPPKSDWIKDQKEGFIRMLQIRDFTQPEKNNIEYIKSKSTVKTCIENDILIGRYGASIGKICTGLSGAYNVALIKTIPNSGILDRNFLLYILKGYDFQNFISNIGSRAAQAGFNKTDLENFVFPLPPIPQQQKIAAILDAADALRQNDKALLAKYAELTQALFLDMFGDPVSNPKGWEIKTIEQITKSGKGSIKRGPFGGALKKEIFVEDGYLVYEQYHALNNDFSRSRYFIDEKKFNELKGFEVHPGDIIISCSGVYLGKLAVIPKNARKGIINQALLKVTLDESKMTNEFFVFLFSHKNFREKHFDANRGAGIPNFPPMVEFKKFPFISPPMNLQNIFGERVALIEEQRAIAQASLIKSEELFNSLLQKAFKGELV